MSKKKKSNDDDCERMEMLALESLVSEEKIEAFMECYENTDSECLAQKVFTDEKLRSFFGAYPIPGIGDPMAGYLKELAGNGFRMHVSVSGEPAIFTRFRSAEETFSITGR